MNQKMHYPLQNLPHLSIRGIFHLPHLISPNCGHFRVCEFGANVGNVGPVRGSCTSFHRFISHICPTLISLANIPICHIYLPRIISPSLKCWGRLILPFGEGILKHMMKRQQQGGV